MHAVNRNGKARFCLLQEAMDSSCVVEQRLCVLLHATGPVRDVDVALDVC